MREKFLGWLKEPFSDDMDATGWFLFFGLMIAISVMWSLILRQIAELIRGNQ